MSICDIWGCDISAKVFVSVDIITVATSYKARLLWHISLGFFHTTYMCTIFWSRNVAIILKSGVDTGCGGWYAWQAGEQST